MIASIRKRAISGSCHHQRKRGRQNSTENHVRQEPSVTNTPPEDGEDYRTQGHFLKVRMLEFPGMCLPSFYVWLLCMDFVSFGWASKSFACQSGYLFFWSKSDCMITTLLLILQIVPSVPPAPSQLSAYWHFKLKSPLAYFSIVEEHNETGWQGRIKSDHRKARASLKAMQGNVQNLSLPMTTWLAVYVDHTASLIPSLASTGR